MAYYLSGPVLQAMFVAGGVTNMPAPLKLHLINESVEQKGVGWFGDLIPRLATGENVEYNTNVVQGAPLIPPFVSPPATATGRTLTTMICV